jgi:hypothetical protein
VAIAPVNDAPVITSAAPDATEDVLYTYDATESDLDGPGATWSVDAADTCGGIVNAATGSYSFALVGPTPPASCVVSLKVCDGGAPDLCATQTTTVTITPVNDAPVITSSAATTATEGVAYTYAATLSDPDGPTAIWSVDAADTCGGTINAGTGTYTFTPAGPTPPASCVVSVSVCDGASPSACAVQTTTVSITNIEPPESCGCSGSGSPLPWWALALLLLVACRRGQGQFPAS